ncbi:ATP-binding cassette domain-containing protein [Amnibacterium kyonggiense]
MGTGLTRHRRGRWRASDPLEAAVTETRGRENAAGLRIESLHVGDGTHPIVAGLDLVLPPGSVLGIIGQSGSGKTTLLQVLSGERAPDGGRVLLDGDVAAPAAVGVATQQHELLGGLTAAENVASRVLARRRIERSDWAMITGLLADLGLPRSSWHNLLEQLSGGQQQRVAVARALVDAPRLVCLDDPTSELDDASAELVWSAARAAAEAGAVVVIAVQEQSSAIPFDEVVRMEPVGS